MRKINSPLSLHANQLESLKEKDLDLHGEFYRERIENYAEAASEMYDSDRLARLFENHDFPAARRVARELEEDQRITV